MINKILKDLETLDVYISALNIDENKLKEVKECIVYKVIYGEQLNIATLELIIIAPKLSNVFKINEKIYKLFATRGDRTDVKYAKVDIQNVTTLYDQDTDTRQMILHLDFIGKIWVQVAI